MSTCINTAQVFERDKVQGQNCEKLRSSLASRVIHSLVCKDMRKGTMVLSTFQMRFCRCIWSVRVLGK